VVCTCVAHPHPETSDSSHYPIPVGSAWPRHPFPPTTIPAHGHLPSPSGQPVAPHHLGLSRADPERGPGPAGATGGAPVCFVKRDSKANSSEVLTWLKDLQARLLNMDRSLEAGRLPKKGPAKKGDRMKGLVTAVEKMASSSANARRRKELQVLAEI
jgi:hypothetical protein